MRLAVIAVRKNKIRRYAASFATIFVMQAAEYGSFHRKVSDGQAVSVRVGPRSDAR